MFSTSILPFLIEKYLRISSKKEKKLKFNQISFLLTGAINRDICLELSSFRISLLLYGRIIASLKRTFNMVYGVFCLHSSFIQC